MDKRNAEGYYDPTAYNALTKIMKDERKAAYKPLVYICSPFRGDTKRYTELKPRITPEELAKGGGTMDNSLGTLFLGELPS